MTVRDRSGRGVVAALTKAAGGPARLRVIAVLALVVGLEAAGNGTVGALIGVLTAGRIADWLIARGHVSGRMTIAGSAFLAACIFLVPALLADDLAIAVMFAFIAAIGLGGVSPPLNAGRLDIMHSRLWGRAEAVRTTLRSVFIALAPLVFGFVSTQLSPRAGLQQTFLIMLTLLFVAGALIVFVARRTYPRDVATAVASERATRKPE